MVANQKNNHVTMRYFNISFLSCVFFLDWMKIKPDSKASNDNDIIHKSILLSTITRNAHIQPVSHNSKKYHHIVIQCQFDNSSMIAFFHFFSSVFSSLFSLFLLFIKPKIWKIIAIQKIRTKVALILFIETAILSEDNPNHQLLHLVKEKTNVKNCCQNHGILLASVLHQYIQLFSANIFGIYIYSWFASQAVEYGTKAFWIHIYRYAREKIIGNNMNKNQIFFHKFSHDKTHLL